MNEWDFLCINGKARNDFCSNASLNDRYANEDRVLGNWEQRIEAQQVRHSIEAQHNYARNNRNNHDVHDVHDVRYHSLQHFLKNIEQTLLQFQK